MTTSYLLFLLADRVFGTKLSGAKEIFPWQKPRRVPLAYSFVEGLIEYRGTVYPVFDVERRLGLRRTGPIGFNTPEGESPRKDRSIILIEEKPLLFGITVDGVLKMAPLEVAADAPKKAPGIDQQFVRAVVKIDDQDIILLDFERMFHAG